MDPADIKWVCLPKFHNEISNRGTHIIGGEWDQECHEKSINVTKLTGRDRGIYKVKNYRFYTCVRDWILNECSWDDTPRYTYDLDTKGQWKAENRKQKLRDLLASIKNNGYLSQHHISDLERERERERVGLTLTGCLLLKNLKLK
ncbi:hypothetical protein OB905_10890 [Halobacteria archaeon AArc-dxtr1]|nr:hypothetical protein [Halobacteria archaeon AArc-dxtr1]